MRYMKRIADVEIERNLGSAGADLVTMGYLFESLCVRDLRIYLRSMGGGVYHYRDKNGLEVDAIARLDDGRWGAIEVKLGGQRRIDEGAKHLSALAAKVDQTGRRGGRAASSGMNASGHPPRRAEAMAEFKSIVPCLFSKMLSNSLGSRSLAAIRDTLLPKLMSGEIDVSEINMPDSDHSSFASIERQTLPSDFLPEILSLVSVIAVCATVYDALSVSYRAELPQALIYIEHDADLSCVYLVAANLGKGVAQNLRVSGFDFSIVQDNFGMMSNAPS